MKTYEIYGTSISPRESYVWNTRENRWEHLDRFRGDGTATTLYDADEAAAHLTEAQRQGEGLRDIHIKECEIDEEDEEA